MKSTLLSLMLSLGLAAAAHAASQSFYFHPSASPVTVPGGTTLRFLDQTAPATATVSVDSVTAPDGGPTVSFTPFTAPAFAATTVLGPLPAAELNLSSNLNLNSCVDITVVVEKLSSAGVPSALGTGQLLGASVPQGTGGGTGGFNDFHIPLQIPGDRTIMAGESIRATVSVLQNCGSSNHPLRLAFDSTSAQTRLDFVALDALPAKCLESIDKAVTSYVKSRMGYLAKCQNGINEGSISPQSCQTEVNTAAKLTKNTAKAVKAILKKCNDSFVIGLPPGGIGAATCPGLTGQCAFNFSVLDDTVRGNNNDYVDCMLCMADRASDTMSGIQYQTTSPPTLDATTEKCQETVSKAAITFQNKKLKLLQNCRKLVNKGKYAGVCPDPKTVTKITTAQGKVATQIAKICFDPVATNARPTGLGVSVCPGPPVACQGAVTSIATESTCMSCTHGFFDDCLYPATIGQSAIGCP